MRIRKNGKVIRLTESDLMRITRKVLREQDEKEYKYPHEMDPNTAQVIAATGLIRNLKPGEGVKNVVFDGSMASEGQSLATVLDAMDRTFNCGKEGEKEICKYKKVNKSGTPWMNLVRDVQKTMKNIYNAIGSKTGVKGVLTIGKKFDF